MNKFEQALIAMRKEAAESAERKLGRKLTAAESAGLEAIKSGQMLESICQGFAFEGYSSEQVAEDLAAIAKRA